MTPTTRERESVKNTWKTVVLRNFSIFREQPQRKASRFPAFCAVAPTVTSAQPSGPVCSVVNTASTSTVGSHLNELHVRLSLPDVNVPEEEVSPSQSSYSLPMMRRARSIDVRQLPPVPLLSISGRTDNQHSTVPSEPRSPVSPHHRAPSPDTSTLFPIPDPSLRSTCYLTGARPRSVSPASPLLSPSCSLTSESATSPGAISPIGVIQPDLYKTQDMVFLQTNDSEEADKYGRLHFRLKYDFDRSDLVVHVIEAQDLGTLSENGFNDPYVKITLLPEVDSKQRQTDICRNSTDPVFDEIFKIPVSFEELYEKMLLLQVFDYDRYSRNDVTGEVRVQMRDIEVTTEVEVWSSITKTEQVSQDRPEILLSLNYLPSAGRLTVVVLKASNLVSSDNKGLPDSYVKVGLTCGYKRMKKKKTSIKKGSRNPVWNEALSFDISEEDLKHSSLVVNVTNCHHGNSSYLGTCILGESENGKESSHWEDMILNPRKSMAMWHNLHL
ncbi:synaptotagmin-1-like isoform X2 [Limulus polyphemus]|uniref:Synaptotagmin-1-like isoform X2 n=1 Tax=Limulus polyphemus TaxID=6850 RepID=A0ABM1S5B3_LIMPO|nr:synaptotagmin-1-like isoform X2 [Limulus polyphemus]